MSTLNATAADDVLSSGLTLSDDRRQQHRTVALDRINELLGCNLALGQ